MGIRFHPAVKTRLLCAPELTGVAEIQQITSVLGGDYEAKAPWRDLGIGQENPVITVRSGSRAIVFDATGSWSLLEALGVNEEFPLAMMQVLEEHLIVCLTSASIDYLEVVAAGDQYRGRVDLLLFGDAHVLEVKT